MPIRPGALRRSLLTAALALAVDCSRSATCDVSLTGAARAIADPVSGVRDGLERIRPPAPTPMAQAVAALGCPVIVMHNRPQPDYGDFWRDLLADLQLSLALAAVIIVHWPPEQFASPHAPPRLRPFQDPVDREAHELGADALDLPYC